MDMFNIITNNPFRVLGVYSNSKQADIVRNISKMMAYLNVGRTVEFPTDMQGILPDINRTTESVQSSQAAINLPNDKIRYALFWFCNGDAVDMTALSYLASGDAEKAQSIFARKESYSSLINRAVLALIKSDHQSAYNAYSQLVHDYTYRGQFCASVCGDTFQITEDELSHLFLDELLKDTKASTLLGIVTNESDKSYVREKAVQEPLSLINREIAKAKSVSASDAATSLKAGRVLIRNTRNALSTLRSIVGVGDIQYQSVADNLAKQVLQCGINYYNKSDDDNGIDNGLELQEYALSIACGKLTKDRCKKNVNILRKLKQQAAFEEDISAIADALSSASEGVGSISKSLQLLDSCAPHLSVLKTKMGANDSKYLQISSAIANNALSLVIEEFNKNSNSRTTAKSAQEVITRIQSMDLDSQTRSRVSQNAAILSKNMAEMPTGFEKVDKATGGCLGNILFYMIIGGIICLIYLIFK